MSEIIITTITKTEIQQLVDGAVQKALSKEHIQITFRLKGVLPNLSLDWELDFSWHCIKDLYTANFAYIKMGSTF